MNKHKTVEELEHINDLIQRWKNAPDDEAMDALIKVQNAIERAYNDYMISEKMYNDYNDLFQDHIDRYIDNDDLLEGLKKKTDENINIVEQADDKIAKSLDLGERTDDDAEHNVDSKKDLQYIKDVMNQYWHERDEKEGVLSAVDKFTEIGDAIKKSLEEKKISRMTAAELMEPLREIKDNMCDINKENAALDRFEEILDKKLAREDERDSQNQQQDQQQANESILGSAETVVGRTIDGVTKALKTIHDKTEEQAQRAADEYDRQQAQKEAERNKSPLSPEQIEQFESLKKEFLRRYHRAQVYHRNFPPQDEELHPISGPFWANTVDAMEPLANKFKELDIKAVTDTKQLEDLARQWGKTMADMAQVYNWLDNQRTDDGQKYDDVAYDDVWDNIDRVDDVAGRFFAELGLNQQHGKEAPKKEYVKPETRVEQKQPQEPVMQQQKPTQSQENVIIKPVAGTPQGSVDSKKQEKKDITPAPEDLMAREDRVQDKDKQNPKREALLKLSDLYNKLISARAAFDENPSSLEALNKAWDDFYFSFYRDPNLQDFKSEFNQLTDRAYSVDKTGFPTDDIKKLINKEFLKEFGHEVPQYTQSERQLLQEEQVNKGQPNIGPERKEQANDVAQVTEDMVQTEAVSQVKPQEKQNTNEAAIARLRQIVDMFDRQNSDESFKKMMFALKEVADSKMVPDEMVDAYRAIFEKVKKHGNTERGILDLSSELYDQIDELQNPGGERQVIEENTPRKPEKVMTHEDVAQEKSDLKPKSDIEVKQQTEVREDMMVRKDARPGNADEKDKKQQVQHSIDNFTKGNQEVLDMDNKRENSKKKLNQAALAEYRRRVLLEGRGTSNV